VPQPPTAKAKIEVKNLSKRFPSFLAIDDLTFEIPNGSFFVIVGPSGCGKTTLLRILAGLEDKTTGFLSIGEPPAGTPGNSLVFQGDSIFPWFTVRQNAGYGLAMRGVPAAEISDVVGHYLERTGLTSFADHYPHQLSGGMKQRVSIARAFANAPDILLMDEPFSALDEQNRTILQQELLRIWDEERKTVVFITHSVDEAVSLGDQILVMTAAPGQAKALIDVPFPRPRNVLELRHDPRYGEIVYQIWGHLKSEVDKARLISNRKSG
jgi:NitT/TauT family transport system ATP-binding protein